MADECWGSRDVFAVVEVAESQELRLVMDTIQRPEGLQGQAPTSPSIRSSSGASPHTELVRHVPHEALMKRGHWRASPWVNKKVSRPRYSA